jgi:hypothetical protein
MFGSKRFALMSPEGDESGGGAPGGGSLEGDQGTQSKDDVVPKSQFLAALSNAEQKRERELAALRAEFEAKLEKATAKPVEAPKVYTRAELNALVAAGQINQEQADAQMDIQTREAARAEAREVATNTVTQAQQKERVTSDIARYVAVKPELKDRGSADFQKVAAEYQFLVGLGDPPTLATELKAIRAAFGAVETIEQAAKGRPSHDSHQEHGAGGGSAGPKGGKGTLKLSERERAHYEPKVGPGKMYPDWKAVEEELSHASASTRRKHGAPV